SEGIKGVLIQKKAEYERRIEFLKDSKSNNVKLNKTNKSWIKTEVAINDLVLKKGEMYCYPNPAIDKNPKLHIEVGYAEKVEIVIYDISGRIKDKLSIKGEPEHTVNGYAYETEWKAEGVGSGVYIMEVKANKGSEKVSGRIKCAIIK
ncbi:MAG TPA: T9SS type A sorting domain-containing protein, partial [Elusimicrobiales bacterium]|nr:T9SS type A sorting domain-containing protein [Elusimicrobiales bacterium]